MNNILNFIAYSKKSIPNYEKNGGVFYDYFNLMNKNENYELKDIENLMMRIVSLRGKNGLKKSLNFCKNIMMKNVRKIHFEIIREYNKMKERSGERNYVSY
jgi:hypothetical protein